VTPWWRGVEDSAGGQRRFAAPTLSLPKSVPWPMD